MGSSRLLHVAVALLVVSCDLARRAHAHSSEVAPLEATSASLIPLEKNTAVPLPKGTDMQSAPVLSADPSHTSSVAEESLGEVPTGEAQGAAAKISAVMEAKEKMNEKAAATAKEVTDDLDETMAEFVPKADKPERELKAKAQESIDQMTVLAKKQGYRKGAAEKIGVEATNLRREQWLDAKARQRKARRSNALARLQLVKAQFKQQEISADNEIINSTFKTIRLDSAAFRHGTACQPYPACMIEKRDNGGLCGNSYPTVSCIKARRGEINLCAVSSTIQANCCDICLMDNVKLCIQERYILAGYGDQKVGETNVTVPVHLRNVFDEECGELERKSFTDYDNAQTKPLTPGYNAAVRKEYQERYPNGVNPDTLLEAGEGSDQIALDNLGPALVVPVEDAA